MIGGDWGWLHVLVKPVKKYDWCKMTNRQRKLHLLKLDPCANEIEVDQGFDVNEDAINNGECGYCIS